MPLTEKQLENQRRYYQKRRNDEQYKLRVKQKNKEYYLKRKQNSHLTTYINDESTTEPSTISINTPIITENWIYLMRFTEIISGYKIDLKGNKHNYYEKKYIYKPGKTNQPHVEDRCNAYKSYNEPIRLFTQYVENADETEKKILNILNNTNNIDKCNFGLEYFYSNDEKIILKIVKDNC
jgi:hypothetical protein